jgi:hypothetical protein
VASARRGEQSAPRGAKRTLPGDELGPLDTTLAHRVDASARREARRVLREDNYLLAGVTSGFLRDEPAPRPSQRADITDDCSLARQRHALVSRKSVLDAHRSVRARTRRTGLRAITVDSLPKLVDGFTRHAATTPTIVLAGATLKPSDVVARLQALIARSSAVDTAGAAWQGEVTTELDAVLPMKPQLGLDEQMLEGAYVSQLGALADFGLAPRKKAVVYPRTCAAAAVKARATRAARGTTGENQRRGSDWRAETLVLPGLSTGDRRIEARLVRSHLVAPSPMRDATRR